MKKAVHSVTISLCTSILGALSWSSTIYVPFYSSQSPRESKEIVPMLSPHSFPCVLISSTSLRRSFSRFASHSDDMLVILFICYHFGAVLKYAVRGHISVVSLWDLICTQILYCRGNQIERIPKRPQMFSSFWIKLWQCAFYLFADHNSALVTKSLTTMTWRIEGQTWNLRMYSESKCLIEARCLECASQLVYWIVSGFGFLCLSL